MGFLGNWPPPPLALYLHSVPRICPLSEQKWTVLTCSKKTSLQLDVSSSTAYIKEGFFLDGSHSIWDSLGVCRGSEL